jgi:hypothetical protein
MLLAVLRRRWIGSGPTRRWLGDSRSGGDGRGCSRDAGVARKIDSYPPFSSSVSKARPAQSPYQGQQHLGEGWPWHTSVFVQWDATATLLNGDDSYFNRGFHVITMRWGKVYALDVFEDSQEVARGLAAQAASGLKEAVAEQIVS